MSDLANRLVTAAETKLNELHAADGAVAYPTAARLVTAVVLREVADELFESLLSRVEPGMVVRPNVVPELLRQWAKEVSDVE